MTAPLVPADVDLTDFDFMPIEVRRLLKSETWSLGNGDERAAAISLWLESWHQVPAGSLPSNERMLARLADTKNWKRVSAHALRGWVVATDGRLYHPVVAEKVLEAWLEKLAQRLSSGAGNAKRWGLDYDPKPTEVRMADARTRLAALNPDSRSLTKKRTSGLPSTSRKNPGGNPEDIPPGSQGTGTGTGTEKAFTPESSAATSETYLMAAAMARALRSAGWSECAEAHPDLVQAAIERLTVDEITTAAKLKRSEGKPISYVVAAARGAKLDAVNRSSGQQAQAPKSDTEMAAWRQAAYDADVKIQREVGALELGVIDRPEFDQRVAVIKATVPKRPARLEAVA